MDAWRPVKVVSEDFFGGTTCGCEIAVHQKKENQAAAQSQGFLLYSSCLVFCVALLGFNPLLGSCSGPKQFCKPSGVELPWLSCLGCG